MVPSKGPSIGDILTVPGADSRHVKFSLDGAAIEFDSIRINTPSQMSLNHKKCGPKFETFVRSHAENRL